MSAPSAKEHNVPELTRTAQSKSSTLMGSDEDPETKDAGAVAGAVFGAVFIYIVHLAHLIRERQSFNNTIQGFFVFCGLQAFLHMRESRRGAISLS